MMQRYCALIEYQGYKYSGWQCQPFLSPERTIEAQVTRALSKIAAEPITCVCAGRTDAGVNALGQVIHFDSCAKRSLQAWTLGANSYLPSDIRIVQTLAVSSDFDARRSALRRTYRYLILNRGVRSGVFSRHCLAIYKDLQEDKMRQAALCLLGEHDFSAFRSAQCQAKSPFRRIEAIRIERKNAWIVLEITGNAFLHNMVRNIVGSLLEIGKGNREVAWLAEVLESRDRRRAGATAVPEGLYLYRVEYPERFGIPVVAEPAFVL